METQRNILLRISYDGTFFSGWQKQVKNGIETFPTIQGEIEKAASKIHKQKKEIIGSGRTDTGVHAIGQAANFFTEIQTIEAKSFIPAFNSLLPKQIRVVDAQEVSPQLHARFSAQARTYRYFIQCAKREFAHEQAYCWQIKRYPDISTLNRYAAVLRGELDCTSFSFAKDQSASKSRYIFSAHFFIENDFLVFEISANAFLWRMVRSLTGTLLRCEKEHYTQNDFKKILELKDRGLAGPTAPPQGLFLWHITYPEDLLKGT
ncbi:tRNA pseudouridine(38-40) synthase TruA [Treponema phagedenis]|uniref:tRNA pseudouridine synthase A n=1 Tax=Treponema phagedenis TaxID=162 RepID=A0A0B7GYE3_TREPH|nr:tRNA pseudouridine(38-40) synthase TruA [Treponema phagedenis]NVP24804.1 tRNA pseudouridine(38-40) synthase TruA [Treponema phagedenis]QEK00390.1 tRNA pseudouridine(38-40) synthase TruA [Treponema phagedenis]QEK05399.1 tRNA pseudouridine(38-40) synthase TruA [Treponema phagedenis]QKS93112.1 tRNA pseudouridine(38-40) synthase TruA [Treponema phagedenis]QLC58989.1 tRNA pseudouridine(38-40) synthase TruA [Treponema phagedenis]